MKTNDIVILNEMEITFKEFENTLYNLLNDKIFIRDANLLKLLFWDIIEYLQILLMRDENLTNTFYSQKLIHISTESAFHTECQYFLIYLENYVITICLATRV